MKEELEKGTLGISLEAFLKDEGLYEDATEYAIKHVLACQLEQEMRKFSTPQESVDLNYMHRYN